jgi:hypothetical protein
MRRILILMACLMLSACATRYNLSIFEKDDVDRQISQILQKDMLTTGQAQITVTQTCNNTCYVIQREALRNLLKWTVEEREAAYLAGREDERKGEPVKDPRSR